MENFEYNYIQIPDDVGFLLDLCRDLINLLKRYNPNEDIPIDREQLVKLNRIAKRIR